MTWAAIEKAIVAGYNLQWLLAAFVFAILMSRQALAATTREGRRMGLGVATLEAATGAHRLWWFAAAALGPGIVDSGVPTVSPYLPFLQEHRWALFFVVQAYAAGSIYALHVAMVGYFGPRWWFWAPYLLSLSTFFLVCLAKLG